MGRIYFLEVNANPQTTHNEDYADSAEHYGFNDKCLLQEVMPFLGDELLSERVMVKSREYVPQPVAWRQARKQPWQKTMRRLPVTEHFFRPLRS